MSQRGSKTSSITKTPPDTQKTSRINYNTFTAARNQSQYDSTPQSNMYTSAMSMSRSPNKKRLSSADVGKLTGSSFKDGQIVKGQSRISYVPYEKKIVDYEMRTYTELVPKKTTIVDYQQKKVIQNVPRQVVRQEYYPVQRITKYCKEIVDIKPVEKKVKRLQYVPVEKQIVHYPDYQGVYDHATVMDHSKVHLLNQGVIVKNNAEFRPIQQDSIYRSTGNPSNLTMSVKNGVYDSRRLVSTSPQAINSNLTSSKVQVMSMNPTPSQLYMNQSEYSYTYTQQQNPSSSKISNKLNSKSKLLSRYGSTGNLSAISYL